MAPTPDPATLQRLVDAARAVRAHAHAPYSGFRVGAALLDADGAIHTGVNVENASLGLSVCAERNAVFAAVARGVREFVAVAIATDTPVPTPPCGACRQVLVEFAPDLPVILAGPESTVSTTLPELLPHAFVDFRPETR